MDVAAHIAFYYVESRLCYIYKVLQSLAEIPQNIHVFIYTNKKFDLKSAYSNMVIEMKYVNYVELTFLNRATYKHIPFVIRRHIDPYFLTWENRRYVERNIDKYDVQMYLEDDICFTNAAFEYWLKYKEFCKKNDYNIGFLRYEVNNDKIYCTDLTSIPDKIIYIDGKLFLLNDNSPYCGFWIYDKSELYRFTKSKEWKFKFKEYKIREKSAIGWNGVKMKRYKGSIIPLKVIDRNTIAIHNDCKVHHLANNYIGHSVFCTVELPIQFKIMD
jgi:hypothetical protein